MAEESKTASRVEHLVSQFVCYEEIDTTTDTTQRKTRLGDTYDVMQDTGEFNHAIRKLVKRISDTAFKVAERLDARSKVRIVVR